MFQKKSFLNKFFAITFAFSFLLVPNQAKANMGTIGKILGGALVVVGAIDVYKGIGETKKWCPCAAAETTCKPGCFDGKVQIGKGLLEMAGGMAAMMNNASTEKQLNQSPDFKYPKQPDTTIKTPNIPNLPNLPDGTKASIPDKCKEIPELCKCNDASCNQPTLQLPPKEELESLMKMGTPSTPADNTTLEEALSKLNENYDKAKEAADNFNKLSAAGAFDPSGMSGGGLGDSSLDSLGGGDESYSGLDKGGGSGSVSGSGRSSDFDFNPRNSALNAEIDNLKKMRGEPDPVTAEGLNLRSNTTNKVLNIFERAARVLRGDRNRDISLAKIEWTRKEAAKKHGKGPASMPAPKQ
jgi:hypothetical protein